MGLFLSQRWRRQPTTFVEVDSGNILARDLTFVAAPWISREVLSGTAATFSGVTVGGTTDGVAFKSPDNTSGVWFDLPSTHPVYQKMDGASNFSFLFRGGITAYAAYGAFLSIDFTSSHANPFNTLGFLSDGSTTSARFETSGVAINQFGGRMSATGFLDTSGNLATWISAADSGGSSAYRWFKSGVAYADSAAIDANYAPQPLDNNLPVALFAHSDSYLSAGSTGYCTLAAFWARTLSSAEAMELHVNPWQIFKPLNRRIFSFGVTAAGAYTLPVTGGTASVTGGMIAPLMGRKVSVTGGTASVTGGSIAALLGRKVTVSGGTVSVTGGTITLTYAPASTYSLSVTGGSATVTGGTIALKKAWGLSLTPATIAVTGASVTLRYGGESIWTPASPASSSWTPRSAASTTWTLQ